MKRFWLKLKDQNNMRLIVLSALSILHLIILNWMLSSALLSPSTAISVIVLLYAITAILSLLIIRLVYFKHYKMDITKHYTSDLGSGLYNKIGRASCRERVYACV